MRLSIPRAGVGYRLRRYARRVGLSLRDTASFRPLLAVGQYACGASLSFTKLMQSFFGIIIPLFC